MYRYGSCRNMYLGMRRRQEEEKKRLLAVTLFCPVYIFARWALLCMTEMPPRRLRLSSLSFPRLVLLSFGTKCEWRTLLCPHVYPRFIGRLPHQVILDSPADCCKAPHIRNIWNTSKLRVREDSLASMRPPLKFFFSLLTGSLLQTLQVR